MTNLIYMTDSYLTELAARVVSCVKKGNGWEIVLDKTIFYPQGGGQPSDKGTITGRHGTATVKHVRMQGDDVIHECSLVGTIEGDESVECAIDWNTRFHNMRIHSAGHVVHEAVWLVAPYLEPVKGEHSKLAYIEYKGSLPIDKQVPIEKQTNDLIQQNLPLKTEFVTIDELKTRASYVPEHLPKHKPLRILSVGEYPPIPDGGTQVKATGEIGEVTISSIENTDDHVRVHYEVIGNAASEADATDQSISAPQFIGLLLDAERDAKECIATSDKTAEELRMLLLGPKSDLGKLTKQIRRVPESDRGNVGVVVNEVKQSIRQSIESREGTNERSREALDSWFDITAPGIRPPEGHLHIVSQAITEITRIFERIGFTRVRHPEVDWDWYAFESLNMPHDHPARDEWETFFITYPGVPRSRPALERKKQIVLTPHTSNGQVREMEKGKLPIRMINIAKCYRRQEDVSHTSMFHQFEGLFIDKNVSIGDMKGVMDFFFKQYYGPDRVSRIRPFHFQFTEPSFEVDVSCGVCHGKARLPDGQGCRLCKEGWLELGGAGMVHPNVLKAGGIDANIYNGFAFGWGVERVAMMNVQGVDDNRQVYNNDVRFLEQF